MKKTILSLLLTISMVLSLAAVPAAADTKAVRFSDITDKSTAAAVESLRLLGVLDGYADGTFRPGGSLTRAQFCKMAVNAMDGADQLGRYSAVTVFPDVRPNYWAAAQINMASKGKGIIAGFADGFFHPDRVVTVGQAVTILVRLLGYTDEEVGGVWPLGHMAAAASIGLTDGVDRRGNAALSRGQAARLFVNLLRMDMKEGGAYAEQLGSPVPGQLLLSSAAPAPDGSRTGLQTLDGRIYPLAGGKVSNGALDGLRGTLILRKKGDQALTFVPDGTGSTKTGTVSLAEALRIQLSDGAVYPVQESAELLFGGERIPWSEGFVRLLPGMAVTLYFAPDGSVDYVSAGSAAVPARAAVILYQSGSAQGLDALTGGASGVQMTKNGVKAGIRDIRKYDTATYDQSTNTVRLSDSRLTGVYEDCVPGPAAPRTITVMGHDFSVLPTAIESLSGFRPGKQLTLLLTADGQVAGAVAPGTSGAGDNTLGIVRSLSGGAASVELLSGITVEGGVDLEPMEADRLSGQLVRVRSSRKGMLDLGRLTGGPAGDLDVQARTLGGRPLAENVRLFRPGPQGLQAVGLPQLTQAVVPAEEIRYAAADWAGRISLVVLGGAHEGGMVVYGRTDYRRSGDTATLRIDYGPGKAIGPVETNFVTTTDTYVKAVLGSDGSRFLSVIPLEVRRSVPASAWIGTGAVTADARTYTVPADVGCRIRDTGKWVTLAEARAYGGTMDLYVEKGTVRVIEVRS